MRFDHNPLSWKNFAVLLLAGFLLTFVAFVQTSRWSYFFSDRINDQILPIRQVMLVTQQPSEDLLKRIQAGEDPPQMIEITIPNRSLGEEGPDFKTQVTKKAPDFAQYLNQAARPFIFYADIPPAPPRAISGARLVFHAMWGSFDVYFDDRLIEKGIPARSVFFNYPLTSDPGLPRRIIFTAMTTNDNQFSLGLSDRYGLSIRSREEATRATLWLFSQRYYYFGVIALIYLFVWAMSWSLYFFQSPKDYRDIFAFGCLTGFLGIMLMTNLPFFYDSLAGQGDLNRAIRSFLYSAVCISTVFLIATFFRLERHKFALISKVPWIFLAVSLLNTMIFLPFWGQDWTVGAGVLSLLTGLTCLLLFWAGMADIKAHRDENIAKNLEELNAPLPRRVLESCLFIVALSFMLGAYAVGFTERSSASGRDYWVAWSLVPVGVLAIQYQMMMGRGAAEAKKRWAAMTILERLIEVDANQATAKRRKVVIASYDLKGFSFMQLLEGYSEELRQELSAFIVSVGTAVDSMFAGIPRFHKKDGGDEWIFLFIPKSQSDAAYQELFCEVYRRFVSVIDQQIQLWKQELRARLDGKISPEIIDHICENFSIHPVQAVVDDLRIELGNGDMEKGIFKSPKFSLIKGIEKDSRHDAIGMYRSDASLIFDSDAEMGTLFVEKRGKVHDTVDRFAAAGQLKGGLLPAMGLLLTPQKRLSDPKAENISAVPAKIGA